jgi:hypothetical protein
MKAWTTRSGVVLHGSQSCPELRGKRAYVIDESDALPHAVKCTHALCFAAFVRQEAKAA